MHGDDMTVTERDAAHCAYALVDTPIGPCGIAWSERGLIRLQLPERDRDATQARLTRGLVRPVAASPAPHIGSAVADLVRYAQGEKVGFADVPLDLDAAPPFHRAVYDATRKIGWGETVSYGALADRVGAPGAARAVGQALGRNPIAIIIPCHRVLASGQRMGGFSAHGGRRTKERLLALEGVHLGSGTPLLPGLLPDRR